MVRTTIVLIAVAAFFYTVAGSAFVKTEDGDTFYIEKSEKYSWHEALSECIRLKMTLVAVDSDCKRQKMAALSMYETPRVWIGGHDQIKSRQFQWISNSQIFEYTNWREREPNNNNEHCVEMIYPSLKWNDARCDAKHGFICEDMPAVKEKNREIKLLKEAYENQIGQPTTEINLRENVEEYMSNYVLELKKEIQHLGNSINEQLAKLTKISLNQSNCEEKKIYLLNNNQIQTNQRMNRQQQPYHRLFIETKLTSNLHEFIVTTAEGMSPHCKKKLYSQ
ncbi:uncharacterized protein [Musca autumnalis]|uniref:uncharacterized protein n=1 Tax=Musca autumnalis TaxID=221902 RepID=UPI003CEB6082